MSDELSGLILGSGLERGARRQILEAIAHFADNETGIARVSLSRLALRAAVAERTVYRTMPELLADPDLDGLLRVVRAGGGRGNASVYKLDIGRLEPVTQAIRIAGRRVFAGAARAIQDAGLAGEKASPENMRRMFRTLEKVLRAESEFSSAETICALAREFEDALRRRREISIIGRQMTAVEKGAAPVESESLNPDTLSRNPDILSIAHNKDTSPSGISTPAHADDRHPASCGIIHAGGASAFGDFVFDADGLLAHAAVSRSQRLELLHDLQGRIARVTRDGVLAIRCRSAGDADALQRRWLDALLAWAADAGLAGVVFDGEVPP